MVPVADSREKVQAAAKKARDEAPILTPTVVSLRF
jgi:hypothetical protein